MSNYPPGVTGAMIDALVQGPPCSICGRDPDGGCLCPECPKCGAQGEPTCYHEHGLHLSREQVIAWHKARIARLEEQIFDERAALNSLESHWEGGGAFYPADFLYLLS